MRLNVAERRFAFLAEYLPDAFAPRLLNLRIDVHKTPTELLGQRLPHRRLSAAHESDKIQPRRALQLKRHLVSTNLYPFESGHNSL